MTMTKTGRELTLEQTGVLTDLTIPPCPVVNNSIRTNWANTMKRYVCIVNMSSHSTTVNNFILKIQILQAVPYMQFGCTTQNRESTMDNTYLASVFLMEQGKP